MSTMQIFVQILSDSIAPIFLLILVGFFLGKKLPIDLASLSKVYFYVFLPCFLFVRLYSAELSSDMLVVGIFVVTLFAVNLIISLIIGRLRKFDQSKQGAFSNAIMFYNSGNVGVPLITLVFAGTPYFDVAVTAQVVILLFQNVTTNAVGILNAARVSLDWKTLVKEIFAMPSIWVIPTAFVVQQVGLDMTTISPLWIPMNYAADALISVALLTLGVQLSRSAFQLKDKDVYIAVFTRLIGGPILAWLVLTVLNISGPLGQALLISSSVPTAVGTALIAVEFDNQPDFASQVVLTATSFSAFTLMFVIYFAQLVFPA